MNPDALAELEEERRFLLRSITDLEREHDAGDVDDEDYTVLRDGYTARAAIVLRSIEEGRRPAAERAGGSRLRVAVWVTVVIAVAIGAGVLVARASGQRLSGQTITGGQTIDEVPAKLSLAREAYGDGSYQIAAQLYQEVLAIDPENLEARTYIGWLLALSAGGASPDAAGLALEQARRNFEAVIASDPTYADAHCLYAVMAARLLPEPDTALAREQGELCLDADPPADMRGMIQSFVDSL
jgi:tetratricopeptide (TPR) repeat protein